MRLAFMLEEAATALFQSLAVELRSQGCLFKDERTEAWIKDAPSDGESEAEVQTQNQTTIAKHACFYMMPQVNWRLKQL